MDWRAATAANIQEARKRNGRLGVSRTRNGCLTCKRRRIKCDQDRPICRRCMKSKLSCDGYHDIPSNSIAQTPDDEILPSSGASSIQDRLRSPPEAPVTQLTALRIEDRRAFDYFIAVAGKRLAGLLDESFWCQYVLQVAHAEPFVLNSLVAISVLYENPYPVVSFRGLVSSSPSSASSGDAQALRAYGAAIAAFRTKYDAGTATTMDALLSCILFICVELIQNRAAHARAIQVRGKMLLVQLGQAAKTAPGREVAQVLKPLFHRVIAANGIAQLPRDDGNGEDGMEFTTLADAHTALYNLMADANDLSLEVRTVENEWDRGIAAMPRQDGMECNGIDKRASHPRRRSVFIRADGLIRCADLRMREEEGGCCLPTDAHGAAFMDSDAVRNVPNGSDAEHRENSQMIRYARLMHFLQRWRDRFDLLVSNFPGAEHAMMVVHLLLYYEACLVHFGMLVSPTHPTVDQYSSNFERMLKYSETIVSNQRRKAITAYAFCGGAVPALQIVATKCRHPLLRRKALRVMAQAPLRESTYSSLAIAEMSAKIIEIEEEGMHLPAVRLDGSIDDEATEMILAAGPLPPGENRVHDSELVQHPQTGQYLLRVTRHRWTAKGFCRVVDDYPLS